MNPSDLPKALRPYANMIEGYDDLRAFKNGFWVFLNDEHFCTDMGCRTIHEDSLKLCIAMLKRSVKLNAEEQEELIEAERARLNRVR